ncbi:glycine-rich domain-containing protein [Streptomyces sp. NPDC054796]
MTITYQGPTGVLSLISPELRADLIEVVRKDYWPELTDDLGRRGVDQMVAFLATAAHTTGKMAPSLRVDLFWHAFVLHTKPYADFCQALGAPFVHHVPDRGGHDPAKGRAAMANTRDLLRVAGYETDPDFWPAEGSADCTQSYAGCSDSPVNK